MVSHFLMIFWEREILLSFLGLIFQDIFHAICSHGMQTEYWHNSAKEEKL